MVIKISRSNSNNEISIVVKKEVLMEIVKVC